MAINFGQQLGPLPLGGWLAAIGGGVAIALYSRANSSDTVTVKHTAVTDDDGNLVLPDSGVGGSWTAINPPTTSAPVYRPETNEEWGRLAIDWCLSKGIPGTLATDAIGKYLDGQKLNAAEAATVRIALIALGSPPSPPPPPQESPTVAGPVMPAPVTIVSAPTTANPVGGKWIVTGKWPNWDGSLWGIAGRLYGNSRRWVDIYNANRIGVKRPDNTLGMIVNPAIIRPGWRLWVPGAR